MNNYSYINEFKDKMNDLIVDINSSHDGYSFLRVLEKQDIILFLVELNYLDELTNIYETKSIKLSTFLVIMNSIKLSRDYVIYRRAYEGESKGSTKINKQLTNFLVPLFYFCKHKEKHNLNIMNYFRGIISNTPKNHILIDVNHMKKVNFKDMNYRLSSWNNKKYSLSIKQIF